MSSSWSSKAGEQEPWLSAMLTISCGNAPCSLGIHWTSDWHLGSARWQVGFTGLHKHLLAAASFALESLCSFRHEP